MIYFSYSFMYSKVNFYFIGLTQTLISYYSLELAIYVENTHSFYFFREIKIKFYAKANCYNNRSDPFIS